MYKKFSAVSQSFVKSVPFTFKKSLPARFSDYGNCTKQYLGTGRYFPFQPISGVDFEFLFPRWTVCGFEILQIVFLCIVLFRPSQFEWILLFNLKDRCLRSQSGVYFQLFVPSESLRGNLRQSTTSGKGQRAQRKVASLCPTIFGRERSIEMCDFCSVLSKIVIFDILVGQIGMKDHFTCDHGIHHH